VRSVSKPVVNLLEAPEYSTGRQLLFGESFLELDVDPDTGYAFGQALDGPYVGYLAAEALEPTVAVTHRVDTMGAHVYFAADIKSRVLAELPFTARISARSETPEFMQIHTGGYIHKRQLVTVDHVEQDTIATALRFLGMPYLWGGDSNFGLDCSGLVHTCLRVAGYDCPRDSDQQQRLGRLLTPDEPLERGDLVFWEGHVALMCDSKTMVHSNGHHMAVVCEDFVQACARIADSGSGPVTNRRRV